MSRATCPVCNHSYPEHRLKHHMKSSHPGKYSRKAVVHLKFLNFSLNTSSPWTSSFSFYSCVIFLYHFYSFLCLCASMFLTDKVPVRGSMVQRAVKCPYCDSYFLRNSSDFQQHIWAHQGATTAPLSIHIQICMVVIEFEFSHLLNIVHKTNNSNV